jgi:hypothetical protein
MKCRIVPLWNLIVILGVFVGAPQISHASDNRAHSAPAISGTYQVLQKMDHGAQTHLRLQFRFINHGQHDLHIQRLTLWDRHPEKGGTQACSIVIPAGRSAETTQQLNIAHPEYEMWERGTEPRLVLEMQAANGRKITQTVRLSRIPGGKAD